MSTFSSIRSQVRDDIAGLTFSTTPTVVRRKRFVVHPQDTLPIIMVCPLQEELVTDYFESVSQYDYPVFVGIVLPGGELVDDSSEVMAEFREKIRTAIYSVNAVIPLNGSGQSCDVVMVKINTEPSYDRPSGDQNLDVSAMTVTYSVVEPRNT